MVAFGSLSVEPWLSLSSVVLLVLSMSGDDGVWNMQYLLKFEASAVNLPVEFHKLVVDDHDAITNELKVGRTMHVCMLYDSRFHSHLPCTLS